LAVFCFVVVGFWLRKLSAEEALWISGRKHQLLFDSSRDALMMLAPPSWKFTGANQATLKLFGASSVAEFTSLGPWDVSPERQPDGCSSSEKAQEMIAIAMNEGSHNFEWEHQRLNGQSFAADVLLTRMEVGTEVFLQATVRDITERKTLERQNIHHSQHIRALINAANESSFLLTPDGVVLAINDTALRRLRLTEDEALGKDLFDLLPPEVASKRRAIFLDVVQSHKPVTAEDERAGIKFLTTYTPILDESGKVIQVALYAYDVTEQRQLETVEQLLPALNRKLLEGAPLQDVLNMVCDQTVEGFGLALAWAGKKMEDGSIGILASSGMALDYMNGLKNIGVRWDDTPLGHGPTGSAIRLGELQYKLTDEPSFSPWAKAAAEQGIKGVIAFPLIVRGNVYGAFTLYSKQESQLESPAFRKRIASLADKIRLALELSSDHEQISLLSTALSTASNAVMITDPNGRIVWVNQAFVMQSGYASTELIGRTPSILNSGKYDAAYYRHMWQTIMDGKVWNGDTTNKRKDGTLYTVQQTITPILNESGEITHFVAIHEDVTAKLETQARIEYIASHDGLTGLPNRALFFDRLGQLCNLSKRNQTNLAVLFIDLDGFKTVNDKLGHHAGDLLLKSVADRLQACVRGSDTVARLGGDEFTIILFDISGRETIVHLADKILIEMSRPFDLKGQSAAIGASIGIATAITAPEGNVCDDRLVERADSAMYEAKHAGKNCYRFASEQ
jgi:diguanylate cyclase (GGDEF)-like protein/PAS domain S-box-containing protein